MPPSSSSRRPTAPTPRAARCGTSARSSGCRVRSSSPSSTPATPTSRPPWPTARRTSAPASSRSACRCPAREGAVTSIADLLLGEVHDYSGGTRTVRPAGPEHAEVFDTYRPALIEGIIEESEDGALMDRYLEGEELDFADPREGPAHRGRPRHLPPGAPAVRRDRRRRRRAPARHRGRLPAPRAAPAADGHPGGRWRRGRGQRPTPTGRSSPRSSTPSPTPTSGTSRSCGCSPARCAPTGRCTCPATSSCSACRPARVTRPHDDDVRPGRHRRRLRRRPAARRPRRSPVRSWSSPSSPRAQTSDTHLLPRRAAARHAVGAARGAAARRGRRRHPRRRGPDAGRLPRARRRGPVAAHRARRRDRPGRAVDHRPGPPRPRAQPAAHAGSTSGSSRCP